MRNEVTAHSVESYVAVLKIVRPDVCRGLYQFGENIELADTITVKALRARSEKVRDDIYHKLEQDNSDLLNEFAEVLSLWERSQGDSVGKNRRELFLAGALIMYEILRLSQEDLEPPSPDLVRELHRQMNRQGGI